MYTCNICDKSYQSESVKHLEHFVNHVSHCPLRMQTLYNERFYCRICGSVVRTRKSFKKHLIEAHQPNSGVPGNNSEQSTSTRTIKRQKGTFFYNLNIFFYILQ